MANIGAIKYICMCRYLNTDVRNIFIFNCSENNLEAENGGDMVLTEII